MWLSGILVRTIDGSHWQYLWMATRQQQREWTGWKWEVSQAGRTGEYICTASGIEGTEVRAERGP